MFSTMIEQATRKSFLLLPESERVKQVDRKPKPKALKLTEEKARVVRVNNVFNSYMKDIGSGATSKQIADKRGINRSAVDRYLDKQLKKEKVKKVMRRSEKNQLQAFWLRA